MRTRLFGLGLIILVAARIVAADDGSVDLRKRSVGPTVSVEPSTDLAGLLRSQGLLDPARLTTWRSYSFSMSSGPYGTSSVGMLSQHLLYQLSKPLTLHMEVGLLHNPLSTVGVRNGPQQASIVVPAVDLIYRPRDNMVVSFHYSQMPGNAYAFGSPWWSRVQEPGY